MTTLWFLVALTFNADGSAWMARMPEEKANMQECMLTDYFQDRTHKVYCIEADDFSDLIVILLTNFDFGGQPL